MLHPAQAALKKEAVHCDLLGNDDGRVFFSTPTQTSTQGLCFDRGLVLFARLATHWEIPSEASSDIRSIGRPAVGLCFSKDHIARGSPVPNCRDGLVRFLLIAVPGRSVRTRDPMTDPGALKEVRAIVHSQPASCHPAQPTATEAGGPSSARAPKPNRIPRGSQGAVSTRAATPADHEGCQPA